jgi:hypothetical protein
MTQALTDAFDMVSTKFEEDGRIADMFFGWREKERHNLEKPRLVWQPGDYGANIGDAGPNISTQGWPLTFGVLWQRCSIYVSAPADPADPDNERKQWTNSMELRNALIIALTQKLGEAQFRIENERYEVTVGRRAQVVIVTVISFRDDIQDDQAVGLQQADPAVFHVTEHLLDATQEFDVPTPTTP